MKRDRKRDRKPDMNRSVPRPDRGGASGVTLLECIIAAAILLVAITGVLVPFRLIVSQSQGQGEYATRTSELARDKMEELLALSFGDGTTDTTQYPPVYASLITPSPGKGLGGMMQPSSTAGGINLTAPVAGYVDYLDQSGNLLSSSAGSFFERVWSITTDSTGQLKTISVVAQVNIVGLQGTPPATTLVCMKASLQ
jgi:hypothetical protein